MDRSWVGTEVGQALSGSRCQDGPGVVKPVGHLASLNGSQQQRGGVVSKSVSPLGVGCLKVAVRWKAAVVGNIGHISGVPRYFWPGNGRMPTSFGNRRGNILNIMISLCFDKVL